MHKFRFLILLALITGIAALYLSIAALTTMASAPPQEQTDPWVDPQVWAELAGAPDGQTTFLVVMREGAGGGPQSAIPAQMGLEKPLEILQQMGSVSNFMPYYGPNVIAVTGTGGALRFLAGWPQVAEIRAYQPGQPWEQMPYFGLESELTGLDATGQITGTVTGPDESTPLSGILVRSYQQTGVGSWVLLPNYDLTLADGTYTIGGLETAIYAAKFEDPSGDYVPEFYDDKSELYLADGFEVVDGETTGDINASLALAGQIAGTVTDVDTGSPVADIVVTALRPDETAANSNLTAADGTYSLGGLVPGSYAVRFSDSHAPPRHLDEYYDNVIDFSEATTVTVSGGVTTANIDAALGQYGKITGTVTRPDGTTPIEGIYVDAWEYNDMSMEWDWVAGTSTDASGSYELGGLITRDYRVEYSDPLGQFATEFYNDQPDIDSGDDVHVELGVTTPSIDASLALQVVTETHLLVTDWNLISLPLTVSDPAPSAAFSSIEGSYNVTWAYYGCDTSDPWDPWKIYDPERPPELNDLTAVDVRDGYWIDITTTVTLSLNGTYPVSTDIPLCTEWNLIGYPSLTSRPVEDVLADIDGKYDLVWAYDATDTADPWKKYNPDVPVGNDLETMQAWSGYWIDMTEAATLTIPGRGTSSSSGSGVSWPWSDPSATGEVPGENLPDTPLTGPPPMPFNPYGTVTRGGHNVPDGTLISGWCDGVKYGETPAEMYGGQSWYNLEVLRDEDPNDGVREGCYDEEEVSFKVGGLDANETAICKDGDEEVNLTVTVYSVYVPLVLRSWASQ